MGWAGAWPQAEWVALQAECGQVRAQLQVAQLSQVLHTVAFQVQRLQPVQQAERAQVPDVVVGEVEFLGGTGGGVLSQGCPTPPAPCPPCPSPPPPRAGQTHLQGRKGADAVQVSQTAAGNPEHLQMAQGGAQVPAEGRGAGQCCPEVEGCVGDRSGPVPCLVPATTHNLLSPDAGAVGTGMCSLQAKEELQSARLPAFTPGCSCWRAQAWLQVALVLDAC